MLLQNSWMICLERLNPLPAFTGYLSLLNRYWNCFVHTHNFMGLSLIIFLQNNQNCFLAYRFMYCNKYCWYVFLMSYYKMLVM